MKKALIILLLCTAHFCTTAQNTPSTQTPCTTASQGVAGNFIISYTIGEMPLVQSWKDNGLLITQGVLQPITFIVDTTNECFSTAELKVYPNPTNGAFSIQYAMLKKGKAVTVLYNAAGQLLQTDEFDYKSFFLKKYDISKYANGQYYLLFTFTEDGGKVKKCTYTIQKIK
jgi:Secretion system C-terminal sorting domain